MAFPPQCRCVCVRVCELIIAAQLVFCGWSSGILLRRSPGWDHRAGIVLSSGEPAEMGKCPLTTSHIFIPHPVFVSHVSLSCLFRAFSPPPGWFFISFPYASLPLTRSVHHSPHLFPASSRHLSSSSLSPHTTLTGLSSFMCLD